jgi:signal transduction histidine kinase
MVFCNMAEDVYGDPPFPGDHRRISPEKLDKAIVLQMMHTLIKDARSLVSMMGCEDVTQSTVIGNYYPDGQDVNKIYNLILPIYNNIEDSRLKHQFGNSVLPLSSLLEGILYQNIQLALHLLPNATESLSELELIRLMYGGEISTMSIQDFCRYFSSTRIPIEYSGLEQTINGYSGLEIVFAELITNSRKAIKNSSIVTASKIVISTYALDDGTLQITISDTGQYNPDLQSIYEESQPTENTNGNGGFGLAAIREILNGLHGSLAYSQNAVGGTAATITLPKR